jgi:hypothetical protein
MKRILGWGVGVVYLVIAYGAYSRASAGWDAGHGEIGFWWTVVTVLLLIASLAAFVGTWIHTQQRTGRAAGAPTP